MIFFYRTGSIRPFSPKVPLDAVEVKDGGVLSFNQKLSSYQTFVMEVEDNKKYGPNIFELEFQSLFSYLFGLRMIGERLNELKKSSSLLYSKPIVMYLAAAVSDFYIPHNQMSEHKMQSRDSLAKQDSSSQAEAGLTLKLANTPKLLPELRAVSPILTMISFKLETDETILDEKVSKSFKENASDMIVGNTLQNRTSEVFVYKSGLDKIKVTRNPSDETLEMSLVKCIISKL